MKTFFLCIFSFVIILFFQDLLFAQNVGIGVPNPKAKLDIDGNLRIGKHLSDTAAGTIRYNNMEFEGWDSTKWIPLHTLWTKANPGNIYKPTGNVGIGWANPFSKFGIWQNTPDAGLAIRRGVMGDYIRAYWANDTTNPLLLQLDTVHGETFARFAVSNTYPNQFVIKQNGKIGFGTNDPGNYLGLETALVEFADNDPYRSDWVLRVGTDMFNGYCAVIFGKSKGTINHPTPVASNDMLGGFLFMSYTGDYFARSCEIRAEMDGPPAPGSMPGKILFNTASTGSDYANEKMRLTNMGYLGIGTQAPSGHLDVRGGTATSGNGVPIRLQAQNGYSSGNTNGGDIYLIPGTYHGSGREGRVGINTTGPSEVLDVNGRIFIAQTSEPSSTANRIYNVGGTLYWAGSPVTTGGGTGTVTSVAAAAPAAGFTITGSPITSSGTLTFALSNSLAAIQTIGSSGSNGFLKRSGADTWTIDNNTYLTSNQNITLTGDVTGSGTTTIATTLQTVPVTKGGTGQTSYTNGQLLIGNSSGNTLTKSTLTAGNGISITNGTGSITIASSAGSGSTTIYKSSNETRANTTTLNNDAELFFSTTAGTKYGYRIQFFYQDASTNGDLKYAVYHSTNVTYGICNQLTNAGGATTTVTYENSVTNATYLCPSRTIATSSGGQIGSIIIDGTIEVNNAGNLYLQYAQNSSNSSALTALRGSTITYWVIP